MTQLPDSLPELPKAKVLGREERPTITRPSGRYMAEIKGFSADRMRAYGLACYQAGLERAAVICETIPPRYWVKVQLDPDVNEAQPHIAAAIRAEKEPS